MRNQVLKEMMASDTRNFTTREFINRLTRRDAPAIDQLVRSYHSHLYRASLAQNCTDEEATEIVSATWSSFFESVPRFEGRSHIRTFLFGILYNKIREFRRQKAKERLDENIDDTMESRFTEDGHWAKKPIDPEKFLNAAQTMGLIESCLEALPDRYRDAFYLKEVEGEDTEVVCEVLGITPNNLGVVLYRARAKLRDCIEAKAKGDGP